MPTSVQVPTLGESVTEAVLSQWLKKEGDHVAVDEPICELESDKATVDLPAPASGVLHQMLSAGETAHVGDVIAKIDEDGAGNRSASGKTTTTERGLPDAAAPDGNGAKAANRGATAESAQQPKIATKETWKVASAAPSVPPLPQSAQKPRKEEEPTTSKSPAMPTVAAAPPPSTDKSTAGQASIATPPAASQHVTEDGIRREPMSRIRRSIAERLVRAQQTTAMLTTFNEIDMTAVQELRSRYKERFFEEHGVPLGIVSLFARASMLALGKFPILNAQIDGGDIVYHDHVHLGVAVSTDRGLVVPVLHSIERLSVARIEQEIKRLAAAAREGKLSIGDLSGGTFTITNGGVFGSLLSTPILHPPQSGILGLHAIQERPVAINRQVEIRPMMYVALSYDHRLVDGHDAVSFLVHIKRLLEDPMQMVLGL